MGLAGVPPGLANTPSVFRNMHVLVMETADTRCGVLEIVETVETNEGFESLWVGVCVERGFGWYTDGSATESQDEPNASIKTKDEGS